MTSTGPDDAYWRRPPAEPAPAAPEPTSPAPAEPSGPPPPRLSERRAAEARAPWQPGYTGPPPTNRPPAGWRPDFVVQPADPRALPVQNHEALDQEERSARSVTYIVGLIAAGVLLVVFCLLCGRVLF